MIFIFWKTIAPCPPFINRVFLTWGLSDVPSWLCILGKNTTSVMLCLSQGIISVGGDSNFDQSVNLSDFSTV